MPRRLCTQPCSPALGRRARPRADPRREDDGFTDPGNDLRDRGTRGIAAREVGPSQIVPRCPFNDDGVAHGTSFLQTGLLVDAVQRAGGKVIAGLAGNSALDPLLLACLASGGGVESPRLAERRREATAVRCVENVRAGLPSRPRGASKRASIRARTLATSALASSRSLSTLFGRADRTAVPTERRMPAGVSMLSVTSRTSLTRCTPTGSASTHQRRHAHLSGPSFHSNISSSFSPPTTRASGNALVISASKPGRSTPGSGRIFG